MIYSVAELSLGTGSVEKALDDLIVFFKALGDQNFALTESTIGSQRIPE